MKFDLLYYSIIFENKYPFEERTGYFNLPQKYLVNTPHIKQCIITNHALLRYKEKILRKFHLPIEWFFKNLQHAFERLNAYTLQKIDEKENDIKSWLAILSTTRQFGGIKGLHLIAGIKVNSYTSKETNEKEYYILVTTVYTKLGDTWKDFKNKDM